MAKRQRLDEDEEEQIPEEEPEENLEGISFYNYMQQEYSGKRTAKGKLAKELMRLAREEETVKEIGTVEELLALVDRIREPKAATVMDELLWEEYLTATGQW